MIRINLKKKLLTAVTVSAIAISTGGIAIADDHQEAAKESTTKTVSLINTVGKEVGTAELTDTPNGLLFYLKGNNMPPGSHSFHIHETAGCATDTEFKSAGGHLNPEGKDHGFHVENGPHAGDLPNIHVDENGNVETEVLSTALSLKDIEGRTNLLDEDGSAIMIHENPDDYKSQPTGGGGARIACAEIK